MSAQILRKGRTLAMRRLALAAIGVSFFVLSGTTMGADLRTGDLSAVVTTPAGRRATAHSSDPPAINAETTAAFINGLHKASMDWTPPPCLSDDKRRTTTRPTVRSFVFPP
jgi:hypothetical protein